GACKPPGFSKQNIRRCHVLVDFRCKPDRFDSDIAGRGNPGCVSLDVPLEIGVASANGEDLRWVFKLQQRLDDLSYPPHSKAAGGNQDGRNILKQAVLAPHLEFVFRRGDNRIDRYTGRGDLGGRYPELFEVSPRLFKGHEISFEVVNKPHRVDVKVCDHYRLARIEPELRL